MYGTRTTAEKSLALNTGFFELPSCSMTDIILFKHYIAFLNYSKLLCTYEKCFIDILWHRKNSSAKIKEIQHMTI